MAQLDRVPIFCYFDEFYSPKSTARLLQILHISGLVGKNSSKWKLKARKSLFFSSANFPPCSTVYHHIDITYRSYRQLRWYSALLGTILIKFSYERFAAQVKENKNLGFFFVSKILYLFSNQPFKGALPYIQLYSLLSYSHLPDVCYDQLLINFTITKIK